MKVTPPAKQRLSWKVSGNHDCICIHSVPFENVHSCAMHNPICNTTKYLIKMSFHISNDLQGPRILQKGKKCMQYMHIICTSFLLLSPSQTDTHTINMQMHEQTDKHTGVRVIYTHIHTHWRSDKEGVPHSTLFLLRLIRVVMNAPDLMCAGHLWFSVIIYLCV